MTAGELAERLGIRFGALDTILGRTMMYSDGVSQEDVHTAGMAVANKTVARIDDEAVVVDGMEHLVSEEEEDLAAARTITSLPGAIREMLLEGLKTLDVKGHEYTRGRDKIDRLANFRSAAIDLDIPMRHVWYIYARKHFDSITTWVKEGKVTSNEPIEGRMLDLMVYLWLGSMIVEAENDENADQAIPKHDR